MFLQKKPECNTALLEKQLSGSYRAACASERAPFTREFHPSLNKGSPNPSRERRHESEEERDNVSVDKHLTIGNQ